MSKVSLVTRNDKRLKLINKYHVKREKLKSMANDSSLSSDERYQARLNLSKLPRNSAPCRYRIRCALTGRGRGNYRKFQLSRNKFRELASKGLIPGVIKASW